MVTVEKIKELLQENVGIEEENITLETKFSDLGIDSLDVVELLMCIEDEFNITVEPDQSIKTVGDLIKKIESLSK